MNHAKWIEQAADDIRSNWIEWEADACELSQAEQSTVAGEQYLHACIVAAIESAHAERGSVDRQQEVQQ